VRPTLIFFAYVMAAYAVAAVLLVPFGDALAAAVDADPHKIISRGGLLLALFGAYYFLKWQRLADRDSLGYGLPAADFRRAMLRGFAVGVVILCCLSLAQVVLELRFFPEDGTGRPLLKVIAQGLLGGLAVGFIEETFFRGALYSAVRRSAGLAAAVVLPSLLFAAVHFIKPQPFPPGSEITLANSLTSLAGAIPNLFQPNHLDSFAALLMVGVFLSLVRHVTGSIAWCIGLHAGWVLVIKLTLAYTLLDEKSPYVFLVGDYDDLIGWLAAAWLGLLSIGLMAWHRRRQTR